MAGFTTPGPVPPSAGPDEGRGLWDQSEPVGICGRGEQSGAGTDSRDGRGTLAKMCVRVDVAAGNRTRWSGLSSGLSSLLGFRCRYPTLGSVRKKQKKKMKKTNRLSDGAMEMW